MLSYKSIWKCIGPIILSALSLFLSFIILQSFASFLIPELSLLARGGLGKVLLTAMVFWQLILFLSVQSATFLHDFFATNFLFFKNRTWLKPFGKTFALFFLLHTLLFWFLWQHGLVVTNTAWGIFNTSLIVKTVAAFAAVFTLAWSEEVIFRGTLYPYFVQTFPPLTSAFISSAIFMFAHNLSAPWMLVTTDWKLGLGLFLLGFMLNLLFIISGKLYIGMGAHAGLVAVKVLLRRAPFLNFLAPEALPFWAHNDLRQSPLVHLLFLLVIIILIYMIPKNKRR